LKKLRFFILLFLPVSVFSQEQEAVLNDLSGGMVSYPSANRIADNAATYIQNFVTDVEPLVIERNGYVKRDSTILGGTKPVYGLWEFVDASGNNWIISYSSRTFYKNTIGQTPTAFGLSATVDQIPDCAKNLGLLMCVNGTDAAWTFNGTSTNIVSGAPLGTHIEAWRTRFAISNISGSKSTVRFSDDGDATTWTIGSNPTDPFAIQVGGANDGEYVRCLVGSYLDSMIIGRKYDIWALDGFDQEDVVLRNVSNNIGCIEPRTPQEVDGELVFLSARGLEVMNARSIRNIAEPVRDITDVIVRNTVNQRSNLQTSQSDWEAGTISPTGKLSTSISPGSVSLATMAATSFVDTSSANFAAGTLVGLSTTTVDGSLTLFSTTSVRLSITDGTAPGATGCASDTPYYTFSQSFTPLLNYGITSIIFKGFRSGSPGNYELRITSNSGTSPSTTIGFETFAGTDLTTDSGGAEYTVTFDPPIQVNSSTHVWVQLVPVGTCDASNRITVVQTGGSTGSNGRQYGSNASNPLSTLFHFYLKINGIAYNTPGSIVSRTFDVGFTTNVWQFAWGTLVVGDSVPTNTVLTFETQSSTNGVSFDSLVPVADGGITTSTVRQYIRYKASFSTTDQSTSPIINDLTLNYGPFTSTGGVFTSQLLSIGNAITAWGPVTISDLKSSGTINYQFGSTNTASLSAITNWTNVINGQAPTVSTNPYAAFRSTFVATSAGANLLLQDFETTWNEGGVIPSPVATVYDRRYWLSYTTSTASAPYLDSILVWQRNKSFTLFRGINAGSFAYWRDNLYFGNSNDTGYVYKFDVGNNDDGAAISSLLFSKSYDLEAPYRDKNFRNSYIQFLSRSSFSGSFSVTYDLDRMEDSFSLGTVNMDEGDGQVAVKLPFSFNNPVQGREIQYKIQKEGTGERLRLYDIVLKYNLEEEN
jgi:hypothetical protein